MRRPFCFQGVATAIALCLAAIALPVSGDDVALAPEKRVPVDPGREPERGGTLVVVWQLEPHTLYSAAGGGSSPLLVNTKILERLVRQRDADSFDPELAESWESSEGGLVQTFHLRRNVRWHDGTPFTSADVRFTLVDVIRPLTSGAMMRSLASVETPDEHTVVLRFPRPVPEFFLLAGLASGGLSILPRHVYEGTELSKNPANNAPVGTGPFRFGEWKRGSHIELVRNDDYWGDGQPYLDRIIVRYIRDPGARAAAMEAGELHLAVSNPFPPPEIRRIGALPGFAIDTRGYETSKWQMVLEMNLRHPILAQRAVRRAIAHTIDRDFIVNTIYYGFGRPAVGPVPIEQQRFHANGLPQYAHDPTRAAALLDEAGYPLRPDGTRFSLRLLAAPWFAENIKTGHYIKQALGDIGVAIELEVPDRAGAIRQIYSDYDFDLSISNAIAGADPVLTTTIWYTTEGIVKGAAFRNASGYSNPVMDQIVERAGIERDEGVRVDLLHQFQRLALSDVPILHLVELEMANVVRTTVHNHSYTSQWMFDSWKELWIEGD